MSIHIYKYTVFCWPAYFTLRNLLKGNSSYIPEDPVNKCMHDHLESIEPFSELIPMQPCQ